MGRNRKPDSVRITVRIPVTLQAELYLRRPELLSASYTARYGGMTEYVCQLIRKDLNRPPAENKTPIPVDRPAK